MHATKFILSEVKNHIGIITLNNPPKKNALTSAMLNEIISVLTDFGKQSIRAVIIRAEKGVSVWSAGHDIDELPLNGIDPLGQEKPLECALNAIQVFSAPVIAMVELMLVTVIAAAAALRAVLVIVVVIRVLPA